MNIGKWTAGIDWGRVPLLKTVLCQKGGTLPLTPLTSDTPDLCRSDRPDICAASGKLQSNGTAGSDTGMAGHL